MENKFIKARGHLPKVDESVFVAEGAKIIGNVEIGQGSSVWYNTTIRGDVMPIRIGTETNIQDGTVIHGTYGKSATTVGNQVTIGHSVVLHGCQVDDLCLIGMGSILMDDVKIGHHSIVGAGSLVTEGKTFEPYSLIVGRPAVFKRKLNEEEIAFLTQSANNYKHYMTWYE